MEEEPRKTSAKDLLFSGDATVRKLPPICPQCGTWNAPEAKFCKKDGVKLPERGKRPEALSRLQTDDQPGKTMDGEGESEKEYAGSTTRGHGTELSRNHEGSESILKKSLSNIAPGHLAIIAACALLIIALGAGSYRYFASARHGAIKPTPAREANVGNRIELPVALSAEPQRTTQSDPEPSGEPAVSSVHPPEAHRPARVGKIIRKEPEPKLSGRARIASVRAGEAGKDAKAKEPGPDPSKVEGRLNKMLRDAQAGGVTAEVNENMTATLKGTVRSGRDRDKALSVAKSVKEVKRVRDIIFVIEPQS